MRGSRLLSPALVAAIVAVGAAGTLLVAVAIGMRGGELGHLAALLLPAAAATTAVLLAGSRLLSRASLRQRFVSVGAIAVLVSLGNLAVLVALMSVSSHDASLMAALLVYSIGTGVAAATVASRSTAEALGRLELTAQALAGGDLRARTGPLDAGPELDQLGRTLDDMASRLDQSIARERESEARRRDLVTAVSHDLRTPLAGLRAMVEAIDEGVVDDAPTLRRYAGEMRVAVESLSHLVDDLFELVQLDAGAIEAETKRARLAEVMQSALAACEGQASEKGLSVEAHVDGAADYLTSPRLVRVLQNLLQNAIRHTPADGSVRMEARRSDDRIELIVEDTGEGIDAAALEHVFEPFWRGDAARSGPGSGLGLALAKRIVEALGGEIAVQSAPSSGARFAVLLPASARARTR
jgi:signal transduction histidine kinase